MVNTSIPTAHSNTVNMDKGVFNCRTCNVEFSSSQAWRAHAKSDTHVTNLKDRVTSSGVVLPSTIAREDEWNKRGSRPAQESQDMNSSCNHATLESDESDHELASGGNSDAESDVAPIFVPDQCLFCGILCGTFEQNLSHMSKAHSFIIPNQDSLIVDVETLIWYLHLVIYGHQECLVCSKTRRSVEGIQQHMMAKAHCRLHVNDDMRDFYDFSEIPKPEDMIVSGESTMKLPSGKILGQRTLPSESVSRRAPARSDPQVPTQSDGSMANPVSELTTRNDRTLARLATQLSQFRAGDQQSLSHLPAYELGSVLASRMRQLSAAKRVERRIRNRLETRGNKTLMKHFQPDVPGRQNG
uniref:C2H2-type domain-containing protein n=1 Tax=Photinus pyralis TaxID=7054 RepID=A0A1Y1NAE7_PHOPY